MAAHWFSDLQIEEASFFHQWEGDCFDQFREQQITFDFSQNQNEELRKLSSYESNINTLSFGLPDITTKASAGFYDSVAGGVEQLKEEVKMALPGNNNKRVYDARVGQGGEGMRKGGNHTGCTPEHIMAERKRRQSLCQRFSALSQILPGLQKMDKASVLGEAIKYLTQLQCKVRDLEAQSAKQTIESAVIVNKSPLLSDNNSSCAEKGIILNNLLEIEAKMTEQTVLIKIHCKNSKGDLVKVLAEIEALGLSVTSTNVMPFVGSSLDITATAQRD